MAYMIGDAVLVPFPYTDLSQVTVRPAIVISNEPFNTSSGEVTVAMVTSQPRLGPTDWGIRDWMQAGLRVPSWARAKFITLDQSLIRFSPGTLTNRDLDAIQTRIRLILELTS